MSWSEIKKAVNSDLSTPLNTLITNVRNHIETAGNIKCVKSVQRGKVQINKNSEALVTISAVNTAKCILITNFSYSNPSYKNYFRTELTNSTTLKLSMNNNPEIYENIDWQVIEFY